ncbi:60S acidic ribosomal protein P2 [Histoplasma ohiense]|nr:60S acidic ribosomal protein P2 [Histoplasma ohiense (nom. inval.)]
MTHTADNSTTHRLLTKRTFACRETNFELQQAEKDSTLIFSVSNHYCQTLLELDVSVSAQLAVKSIDSPVRKLSKRNTFSKMKHIAAYLLLGLGGNTSPSASDIKSVLSSVGIDADSERLEKLLAELEGKNITELIAEGTTKLASVPSGGAASAPAAGGAAAGGAAAAAEKAEEKEEEKEESDEDMGFGLFD